MKLAELAENLGCKLHGNGDLEINGVAPLNRAGPNQLTFLTNPKYTDQVKSTQAGAVLVREPVGETKAALLISKNPHLDFARSIAIFYQPPRPRAGIHATATIAKTAKIGEGASIGAYAVIDENVTVGRNAVIHPHVVIYEEVRIGDDVRIHSHASIREFCRIGNRVTIGNGVVIGGDGFGFIPQADGRHYKITQSGIVVIEDDVEIQTLSAVDRASVGETIVRRGAKIDSMVQIAHSCDIGENTVICGQTGLAGSVVVGKNVRFGGQAGVADHLTIHDNATIGAKCGVTNDIEERAVVLGFPAVDAKKWRRASAAYFRVPDLLKKIRDLEQRLERIEKARRPKD